MKWNNSIASLLLASGLVACLQAHGESPNNEPGLVFSSGFLTSAERDVIEQTPTIRVAVARTNFAPYTYVNADDEVKGFSYDILEALTQALGIELEPVFFDNWSDAVVGLRQREADVVADISYTVERDEFLDFTMGIAPYPAAIVGRIGDAEVNASQDFADMRVAVGSGFVAEEHLRHYYPNAIPFLIDDVEDAIGLVASGEVDVFLGSTLIAAAIIERQGFANLEFKRNVYFGSGWSHIGVRSDWPELASLLGRIASGQRDAIFSEFVDNPGNLVESMEAPLPISDEESALLERFGSLRVGAVRGLDLLNEIVDESIHSGVASEFTSYLSHRLRTPVELVAYDSTHAMLDGMRAGEIDLIPFLTPTLDRRLEFQFSDPYIRIPFLLLGRTDDTRYWNLDSLSGKTLAIREEHPLIPHLERSYPDLKLLSVKTARGAIEALAAGRADAVVEIKLYAHHIINDAFPGEIQVLGQVDALPGDFAFAAMNESAALIPIVNRAIATINEGERNRILSRWVAVDLEPTIQLRRTLQTLVPALLLLILVLILVVYWNRKIKHESNQRLRAEQLVVDMTDRLTTGVFQFKQTEDGRFSLQFANSVAKSFGRLDDGNKLTSWPRFFEHVHPEEGEALQKALSHSLNSGSPFRASYRFQFPDGTWGWIVSEATMTTDKQDGRPIWNGYLYDLSDERALIEKLNETLALKDRFIATAGHELRTPAQSILLGLQSIDNESLDDEQTRLLAATKESAESMSELINDLLDFNRMNAHNVVVEPQPTDLRELLSTSISALTFNAEEKDLTLTCDVSDDVPARVLVDPLRFKQIVFNLIGNAIKYTDTGNVSVRLTANAHISDTGPSVRQQPNDSDNFWLCFSVEDTGIGIAPDQLQRIFEPFEVIGSFKRARTGLGLAISRRIAQLMRGRITVTSELGKGSNFALEVPVRPCTNDSVEGNQGAGASTTSSDASEVSEDVLFVDDNSNIRMLMASLLEREGFAVDEASSGEEALTMTQSKAYAAVITDMNMPAMSGVDLAEHIRAQPDGDIPLPTLILLSGGMQSEDTDSAASLFDAVLTKPVSSVELKQVLDELTTRGVHRA